MAGDSAGAAAHTTREESIARALGALSAEGWRVFHDVRWPGRVQANIDHVVVGPSGVWVIHTKSWSGSIEIRSGALRQDGRRRARHVIASAAAAMAIGELVPGLPPKTIHPVICLARDEPIFGWCGDVMVCSTENIIAFLTSSPRVLDEGEMTEVAEALAISLQCASAPHPPTRTRFPADARVSAPAAAKPQRLPRAPLPEPVRVIALIGAFAVVAALAFQFDLPARLGDLGASAAHRVVPPTVPIGSTVSVSGLGRPSLKVTAGRPVLTRSRLPGVTPTQGHQLVAVPVSVHNIGDRTWRSHADVRAEVTDTNGTTYSSDPAYTSVRGGRALPATITLPAEARTTGLVVFEVPRGVQVANVRLTVGPGLPTTMRWSVD